MEQTGRKMQTRCKHCGHLNPINAYSCESCGYDLVLYGETVVEGGPASARKPRPAPKPAPKPVDPPKPKPAVDVWNRPPKHPKPAVPDAPVADTAENKTVKWILIAAIVLIVFLIDKSMYRQPKPWLWGNASDIESAWLIGYLAFLASIYGPVTGAVAGFLSEVIYVFLQIKLSYILRKH